MKNLLFRGDSASGLAVEVEGFTRIVFQNNVNPAAVKYARMFFFL